VFKEATEVSRKGWKGRGRQVSLVAEGTMSKEKGGKIGIGAHTKGVRRRGKGGAGPKGPTVKKKKGEKSEVRNNRAKRNRERPGKVAEKGEKTLFSKRHKLSISRTKGKRISG